MLNIFQFVPLPLNNVHVAMLAVMLTAMLTAYSVAVIGIPPITESSSFTKKNISANHFFLPIIKFLQLV